MSVERKREERLKVSVNNSRVNAWTNIIGQTTFGYFVKIKQFIPKRANETTSFITDIYLYLS